MPRRSSLAGWPALILLMGLASLAQSTGQTAPPTARELTDAAFAERRRADRLEEGWKQGYEKGIALAEAAIATDPNLADAYYALFLNLARKTQRTGITAQATSVGRLKELLRKTIELDPGHADAWEAQGEMLMRLPWLLGGSEKKGEEALRRSQELDPKWAKPPLRLAELHWKKGEAEAARAEALRARDLARSSGDADRLNEAQELLREIDAASAAR
jgi:tetratricopeptide (TPR) repeat protein